MRLSPLSLQLYLFFLAFASSLIVMWATLVVNKEYVTFTDIETVPAPTDVFITLFGSPAEEGEEI